MAPKQSPDTDAQVPRYPALHNARADLQRSVSDPAWAALPRRLLLLIEGFEEAGQLIEKNIGVCEFIDARLNLADHIWAGRRLAQAADHLAAACRLVAHRAGPEDRSG